MKLFFDYFFLSDRPTQPFEVAVEGDGKRNILLGWPNGNLKTSNDIMTINFAPLELTRSNWCYSF